MCVNFFLIYWDSSAIFNLSILFVFMLLWIFCSLPMTVLGGFLGIKQSEVNLPVKINKVPDVIGPQPFYLSTSIVWLFSGALPFL